MNLEEIKNKLDIIEIVQKYVKLRLVGKYYTGICPFHKETKPSFYVSPEMQIFKCFGCGEGGDVIKLLMKIENLNFDQVLEKLKDEYGFDIQREKKITAEFKKILEINYSALKLFRQELKKNSEVLAYLTKRGLKQKLIDELEIGFAPGNTLLRDFLYAQGYDYDLIKKAGLIDFQNYDRFQSRIIFPLRDEKGRLIGFTGRSFPETNLGPKYLNTPETAIFKKSQFLYGLYQSKEHILVSKKVVLVEGQFDFLLAWQNKLKNVVAVSGSALTEDHLRKLKKYASNLIFAFDNDQAGFNATLRGNLLARKIGFRTFKLIYETKDLADFFQNGGNLFQEEKFEDWLLNYVLENYNDKQDILNLVFPQLKTIPFVEADNYLDFLGQKLNLDKQFLINEFKNFETINIETASPPEIVEEKSLEEKFALKLISLLYALNKGDDDLIQYLPLDFKNLFKKVLENKLSEEEFNYLEMTKNFYLTNQLNLEREFNKTLRYLKVIFLKKNLKNLNDRLKFANNEESSKIVEEMRKIVKELKEVSKNA
jgi:DNA primase